jgi:hypothetical protein
MLPKGKTTGIQGQGLWVRSDDGASSSANLAAACRKALIGSGSAGATLTQSEPALGGNRSATELIRRYAARVERDFRGTRTIATRHRRIGRHRISGCLAALSGDIVHSTVLLLVREVRRKYANRPTSVKPRKCIGANFPRSCGPKANSERPRCIQCFLRKASSATTVPPLVAATFSPSVLALWSASAGFVSGFSRARTGSAVSASSS